MSFASSASCAFLRAAEPAFCFASFTFAAVAGTASFFGSRKLRP